MTVTRLQGDLNATVTCYLKRCDLNNGYKVILMTVTR